MTAVRQYYAPCTHGLEEVLAAELRELGASAVERARGGAHFRGDLELGYKACLWLRSAIRVQEELLNDKARRKEELYAIVRQLDWSRYMDVDQTVAVDGAIRDSFANDPRTPSLLVKDAVVDFFRDRTGRRPNVDRQAPALPLRVVLIKDRARLYRDFCGESLHKRGYRPIQVKSPLNEALAAGLLLLSGWDRRSSLVDPMCGSGTILIEAALLAQDRAPGLHRSFAFDLWPDFEESIWDRLIADAKRRAAAGRNRIPRLLGADRHGGALDLARMAAQRAGVAEFLEFQPAAVAELAPEPPFETVFVNPPYGERLGRGDDLWTSWHDLGTFLHERCRGSTAFVLSGNTELTRLLRLRAGRKWPVKNGPIDCRLLRYDINNGGPAKTKTSG